MGLLHPDLNQVIWVCRKLCRLEVIETARHKAAQERAFAKGRSKAHWGQSAHDYMPVLGADIIPLDRNTGKFLGWEDKASFQSLVANMKVASHLTGIPIVCGADWPHLRDMDHFELWNWQQLVKDHHATLSET